MSKRTPDEWVRVVAAEDRLLAANRDSLAECAYLDLIAICSAAKEVVRKVEAKGVGWKMEITPLIFCAINIGTCAVLAEAHRRMEEDREAETAKSE